MLFSTRLTLRSATAAFLIFQFLFSFRTFAEPKNSSKVTKIGFIAPLTGPFAEWGMSIKRGFDIGLAHMKHKVSVDYQDDQCQSLPALSIANRWVSTNEISLIIWPGCNNGLNAIAPLTRNKRMYLFSTGLLDDSILEQGYRIVNLATQISVEAKALSSFINSTHIKSFALIHGTNSFGEEFAKQIPAFLDKGISISDNQGVDVSTTDFHSTILKVMAKKPDAIFIHAGEQQTLAFLKQYHEGNHTAQIYSQYAVETSSLFVDGGKWAEDLSIHFQ